MDPNLKTANLLLITKPFVTKLSLMKTHIYKKIATLDATFSVAKEPIPFEKRKDLTITPIKKGTKWGINHDCGWFHLTGKIPVESKQKKISALVNIGSEGCVFDESGTPVIGISNIGYVMDFLQPVWAKQEIPITNAAQGGETVDLWIESGFNKFLNLIPRSAKLKKIDLVEVRNDVKALYYDYLSLLTQYLVTSKHTEKRASLKKTIHQASKLMKHLEPDDVIRARNVILEAYKSGESSTQKVYATGHAHLDLAWLWPIRETKRKGSRTFSNQLRNIEMYDNYIFGASQPQLFQWMKEDYPKLYEEIKQAVAQDRIEIQGGMWVESDTNLPSGESLIRQNLYGMEFWQQEFGKMPKTGWLPDVFGFSGNLPQIIKKSNMDYFMTIKLSWNEHNKWPYHSFVWEGIDNSQVIVHIPPLGNYIADGNAHSVVGSAISNNEKSKIPISLMLYGDGDGGGGPGEGHMESIIRGEHQTGIPNVVMTSSEQFFEELEPYKKDMDTHKGEIYLEKHQGTFTTQARTKRFNRKCEQALHDVEFLSLLASKYGFKYPKDQIEKIWKEILLYQFHDIIPGSSIKRVYVEAEARYQILLNNLNTLIHDAIDALPVSDKLAGINTTSFQRFEYIKHNDIWYMVNIKPYEIASLRQVNEKELCKYDEYSMENDMLRVQFDRHGEIISLVTLDDQVEHSKSYLNRLSVYKDKKKFFNAWDIDINYTKKKPDCFRLMSHKTFLDGPSVTRVNTYRYDKSTLIQKVTLTQGKPLVEFVTEVDWHEKHRMLRADFIPVVYSDEVKCDIQFGNIMRSTREDNNYDKAQFEICAHKWVNLENHSHGLSLINDSKYGHRVKNGLVSLNLLRSPVYPDPHADQGIQQFSYAIYPYQGKFESSNVQEYAYAFNNKLIIANSIEQPSLISSDQKNIVIETIKQSQDGKGIVIRVYENQGKQTIAALTSNINYFQCYETNMLETIIGIADLSNLHFSAFEIKSILLQNKN
ncbi:MAG: alpha-mannosidase [Acholeplasmataceae bacterium]